MVSDLLQRPRWALALVRLNGAVRSAWPLVLAGVVACVLVALVHVPASSTKAVAAGMDAAMVIGLAVSASLTCRRGAPIVRAHDSVIFGALATLATSYAAALTLQLGLPHAVEPRFVAVAPLGELACGLAMFVASGRLTNRRLRGHTASQSWMVLIGVVSAVAAAAVLPLHLRPGWGAVSLRTGLDAGGTSSLGVAVSVAAAALIATAAFQLRPRGARSYSGATAWFAYGLVLIAAASLARVVPHGIAGESIPLAAALRICGVAVLLVAARRRDDEIRAQVAGRAALAERRRVARDLHDGLAQDLAFIASMASRSSDPDDGIAVAARRALAITRGVIDDLSDLDGISTFDALDAVAQELEDRFGVSVGVEVDAGVDVPAEISSDLLRIVREAVANAARHGEATSVLISVEGGEEGVVLRVRDDGTGIEGLTDGVVPYGFGLTSMRDRAATEGGELTVLAAASGGTELVVAWS